MNKITSVYLDLIRFLAAVVVFLVHARYERFTDGWLESMKDYGNDAVMVFFVLSGFVIAFCVDQREKTLTNYLTSRMSRLYSVVVPALLITVLLDYIGSDIDPQIYTVAWFDRPVLGFLANLLFLNQLWFLNINAFSNAPFWSLGYEFWYYVIFGVLAFTTGAKRVFILVAVVFIIGPKIILLLPVWLMGVYAYNKSCHQALSVNVGLLLFIGSIILYIAFKLVNLPLRLSWHTASLVGVDYYLLFGESKDFLFSYIVGALVAANFIGLNSISKYLSINNILVERIIQLLASYTFSLYLLHQPLLNFYAAVLKNNPSSLFDQCLLFILTIMSVYVIGNLTEHKKAWWKMFFEGMIKSNCLVVQNIKK